MASLKKAEGRTDSSKCGHDYVLAEVDAGRSCDGSTASAIKMHWLLVLPIKYLDKTTRSHKSVRAAQTAVVVVWPHGRGKRRGKEASLAQAWQRQTLQVKQAAVARR